MKYKDRNALIEERVEDLLSRMSLEEKIGQMCQVDGREQPEEWIRDRGVGSFLHIAGPEIARLQGLARASGHGIPLLVAIDAIHGHAFHDNTTVFPTQLAMGAAWNPELLEEIGRITAAEMRATGIHWTFSPVFDLARDARWGRCDESFGEDSYLSAELGAALIRGYQGNSSIQGGLYFGKESVLACAKHFAAHGEVQGARDSDEVSVTTRNLWDTFFPPFEKAVKTGVASVMAAYHAIDGVPCSANRWLLKKVLREEMGFEGLVVTDWNNLGRMVNEHYTASDIAVAAKRAIESGNDMIMATPAFYSTAVQLVKSGELEETLIDDAVRRVLSLKFKMGLFDTSVEEKGSSGDDTSVSADSQPAKLSTEKSRQLAYEAAIESIVLLKNDGVLPVKEKQPKIAVVGALADDKVALLGDWSFGPRGDGEPDNLDYHEDTVTVVKGLQRSFGTENVIISSSDSVSYALDSAYEADLVVAVIGDRLEYIGELHDRANIELPPQQVELLRALHSTGVPLVSAVLAGKPLAIDDALLYSKGVFYLWNPGMEGGSALAALLKGERTPSGKTSVSFPRHSGQLPVFYNHLPGRHKNRYCDLPSGPLIPFGYGLSYTSFKYGAVRTDKTEYTQEDTIKIRCMVSNTGNIAADEIVQLYVNDEVSSVTTPVLELKRFTRVHIPAGKKQAIECSLEVNELCLVNADEQRVVEPGWFTFYIGGSSEIEKFASVRIMVN